MQYIMGPKHLEENFHATLTCNAPPLKAGDQFDWGRDPKTAGLKDYVKTAHMIGWPGPSDRKAEQAHAEWIVPNMFTGYVTGDRALPSATPGKGGTLSQLHTWAPGNALYVPTVHGESCDGLRTGQSNHVRWPGDRFSAPAPQDCGAHRCR